MPEALKKKSLVSSLPNFCLESHVGKVLIGVNFEFPNQQNIAANSPHSPGSYNQCVLL